MPYTSFFSLFCYSSFPIYTYTVNEEISARGHLYKNPLIQGRLYFSGISFIFLKLLFCLYICASCYRFNIFVALVYFIHMIRKYKEILKVGGI